MACSEAFDEDALIEPTSLARAGADDDLDEGDEHCALLRGCPPRCYPSVSPFSLRIALGTDLVSSLVDLSNVVAGFPSPRLRISRVAQLDAELLDRELHNILQEPVGRALQDLRVSPSCRAGTCQAKTTPVASVTAVARARTPRAPAVRRPPTVALPDGCIVRRPAPEPQVPR